MDISKEQLNMLPPRTQARILGEVLTVAEVSKRLKIHERSVVRAMQSGQLPGVKIGRVWRCRADLLDEFLAGK